MLNGYRDRDMAMAMADFEAAEPAVYIARGTLLLLVYNLNSKGLKPSASIDRSGWDMCGCLGRKCRRKSSQRERLITPGEWG